jgi:hypothetical protein
VRAAHLAHEQELYRGEALESPSFSSVASHRVLMPVHVVEYSYLANIFRVFVNAHSGQAFGVQQTSLTASLQKLLSGVGSVKRLAQLLERLNLPPQAVLALAQMLVVAVRPLLKVLLWPPFLVGSMLTFGAYAWRQSTAALRQERQAFADWAETRAAERRLQASMTDEWVFKPLGRSERDRRQERVHEEQRDREYASRGASSSSSYSAAGDRGRATGNQQQQQRQQESATGQRAQAQQQQQQPRAWRKPPAVDAGDYYAVLGISDLGKRAEQKDITSAFRRELMRYHPDHQQESGLDPEAASERTRLIIKAYGVLRDREKRAVYDASYGRKSGARW